MFGFGFSPFLPAIRGLRSVVTIIAGLFVDTTSISSDNSLTRSDQE